MDLLSCVVIDIIVIKPFDQSFLKNRVHFHYSRPVPKITNPISEIPEKQNL